MNDSSKSKPSQTAGPGAGTMEFLLADLRAAVAQGRGHKALGLVKLLRKHPIYGPAHFELVARAYEARLAEMNAVGQTREAEDLLRMLAAQQPSVAALISRRPALKLELGGGSGPFLQRYGQDTALTVEIDELIRNECRDPRPLATHPGLPATHPVKAGAAAVLHAWEEIERGPGGEARDRMTASIGRHSPFVAWRLFVQALDAFYAGRDAEARACLERIPDNSAVRPLAEIVERLIAGQPPCNSREEMLHARIPGYSLKRSLAELDRMLKEGRLEGACRSLHELIRRPLWSGKTMLLNEIMARFFLAVTEAQKTMREADIQRQLQCELALFGNMPDYFRIRTKSWFWDNTDDIEEWEDVLESRPPPPALEKALIYDRMAVIELQANEWEDAKDADDRDSLNLAESYWRRSIETYPLQEVYVKWHAATRRANADPRAMLENWRKTFPDDETPLLELTTLCRERQSHRKALALFAELECIARGRPEVEALRHHLRLDGAADRLTQRREKTAEQDLTAIGSAAPEFVRVARATLQWIALRGQNRDETPALAELKAFRQPLSPLLALNVWRRGWKTDCAPFLRDIETFLAPQLNEPDLVVNNYAHLLRLQDPVWSMKNIFLCSGQIITAFRTARTDSTILRDIADGLFTIPRLMSSPLIRRLFWALTGNGLGCYDFNTPVFLAYRALLYRQPFDSSEEVLNGPMADDRLELCLAAADRLARDVGRLDTVHAVEKLAAHVRHIDYRRRAGGISAQTADRVRKEEAGIFAWSALPERLKTAASDRPSFLDFFSKWRRKPGAKRKTRKSARMPPPSAAQPELFPVDDHTAATGGTPS